MIFKKAQICPNRCQLPAWFDCLPMWYIRVLEVRVQLWQICAYQGGAEMTGLELNCDFFRSNSSKFWLTKQAKKWPQTENESTFRFPSLGVISLCRLTEPKCTEIWSVRFGSKVGQIGLKWDKSGTFSLGWSEIRQSKRNRFIIHVYQFRTRRWSDIQYTLL